MHHEPLQNEKQIEPVDNNRVAGGGNGVAGIIGNNGVGGGVNTLQNAAEVIAIDN